MVVPNTKGGAAPAASPCVQSIFGLRFVGGSDEQATCRKERQIVAFGNEPPQTPRRKEHNNNPESAKDDEIPGTEVGDVSHHRANFPQTRGQDSAACE
jgi:hypothetical protein